MKKSKKIDSLHFEVLGTEPSKTDQRRALILENVIQIIARDGVDELTFEKIGKRAGMARSHVVYYFPNREALVIAAIRFAALSAARTIEGHTEGAKEWKEKLRRYTEGNFAWLQKHPDHAAVYALLFYLASFKPKYRALHTEIRKTGTDRIEGYLKEKNISNTRSLAKAIQGIITGNLVDVLTTDERDAFQRRRDETVRAVLALVESA